MIWNSQPNGQEIFYDPQKGQFYTVQRQGIMGHWLEQGKRNYIGAPYSPQAASAPVIPKPVAPVTPLAPLAPLEGATGTAAPPPVVAPPAANGGFGDFWSILFGGWPQQQVPLNTSTNGATSTNAGNQFSGQMSYAQPFWKNPPPQGASQQVPKNPPPTGSGIQQTAAPAASTASAPEVPLRPFG